MNIIIENKVMIEKYDMTVWQVLKGQSQHTNSSTKKH